MNDPACLFTLFISCARQAWPDVFVSTSSPSLQCPVLGPLPPRHHPHCPHSCPGAARPKAPLETAPPRAGVGGRRQRPPRRPPGIGGAAARRRGQSQAAADALRARKAPPGGWRETTARRAVVSVPRRDERDRGTQGAPRTVARWALPTSASPWAALRPAPCPARSPCLPGAGKVVSPILSSRRGGPRLPEDEEPPNMASEVSGTSGTPVLRDSKRGGGAPRAPAHVISPCRTCCRRPSGTCPRWLPAVGTLWRTCQSPEEVFAQTSRCTHHLYFPPSPPPQMACVANSPTLPAGEGGPDLS